jgi:ribosome recycling factor
MSEDDRKRAIDELDKLTQSETRKVDDLLAVKEKELMEIR